MFYVDLNNTIRYFTVTKYKYIIDMENKFIESDNYGRELLKELAL